LFGEIVNQINIGKTPVGADLCVCPNGNRQGRTSGEHTGSPLHQVIQWFKTMTTNEYIRGVKQQGWVPFPGKLWQRNYYEHIMRNEKELTRVREYIKIPPFICQFSIQDIGYVPCQDKLKIPGISHFGTGGDTSNTSTVYKTSENL